MDGNRDGLEKHRTSTKEKEKINKQTISMFIFFEQSNGKMHAENINGKKKKTGTETNGIERENIIGEHGILTGGRHH